MNRAKPTLYDIEIAEFNSAGIQALAAQCGITHMRRLTGGYVEGYEWQPDFWVGFYALPHPRRKGWEFRVGDTDAGPVWEEADPQEFAELARLCGVEL